MKWLRRVLGYERGREVPPKPSTEEARKAELRAEVARFAKVIEDYRKMDHVLVKRR